MHPVGANEDVIVALDGELSNWWNASNEGLLANGSCIFPKMEQAEPRRIELARGALKSAGWKPGSREREAAASGAGRSPGV